MVESAALKVPPHSIEAEQSVLGGLLLEGMAWDQIADRLTEDDFYRQDHRFIFLAIRRVHDQGRPCDLITVAECLEQSAELDRVGGMAYLGLLAGGVASAANITAYADIVRERAIARALITVGSDIADSGFHPQGRSIAELLDAAEGGCSRSPSAARAPAPDSAPSRIFCRLPSSAWIRCTAPARR